MDDKELRELPINDEFAQCMKKLRICSDEITAKREAEIKKCNHLFIKIRNCEEVWGFHSSDYYRGAHEVECVHCGLTNRFGKLESMLSSQYIECYQTFSGFIPSSTKYNRKTLESRLFEEIFKNSYSRCGKEFNNRDINLISDECLLTYHPGLLYHLALQINPLGDNKELFEIMKQLHQLEIFSEKIRLQTEEHAISLLERYYDSKSKRLVLKNDNN